MLELSGAAFPQGDAFLNSAWDSGRFEAQFTDIQDCFPWVSSTILVLGSAQYFFFFILFLLLLGTYSRKVGSFKIQ